MASAASLGIARFNRQTLIGGGYELVNRSTFEPNPDYFAALMWSKLVGTAALNVRQVLPASQAGDFLRTYAFCARKDGISAPKHPIDHSIVVLALNFSPTQAVNISIPQLAITSSRKQVTAQRRVWYIRSALAGTGVSAAKELRASSVALKTPNGSWEVLRLAEGQSAPSLPSLEGVREDAQSSFTLQSQSYAFAVLDGLAPQACDSVGE